jgi:hypothetical protein
VSSGQAKEVSLSCQPPRCRRRQQPRSCGVAGQSSRVNNSFTRVIACFTRVKESRIWWRQGGGAFEERASDARHLCLSNDRQKTANVSSATMDPITVAHLGARGAALRFGPEADWKQPFRREAKHAACSISIPHSQGMRRSSATQRRDQATSSCNQLSVVGWGRARMA